MRFGGWWGRTVLAVSCVFLPVCMVSAQGNEQQTTEAAAVAADTAQEIAVEDDAMPLEEDAPLPEKEVAEEDFALAPADDGQEPTANIEVVQEAELADEAPQEPVEVQVMNIEIDESPTDWVWGEIAAIDHEAGTIVIKHLNYETFEDVQTTLAVTEATLFENADDFFGLKVGDRITVDYSVRGARNVAGSVLVDKPKSQTKRNSAITESLSVIGFETVAPSADEVVESQPQDES